MGPKFRVIIVSVLAILGSAHHEARAQAWVGEATSLDVDLDYNLAISEKVVTDTDIEFAQAGSRTQQFTLGAEFVPLNRLALNVDLPLVLLTYTGNQMAYPHPGGGKYDDGNTHATLTDIRGGVRYQILEEPLAVSPHVAVSIPVADYETIGNTVAGRHLKKLHLGLGVGRVIGSATYVHLLYEFSLVEKYDANADTEQHSQNRSDFAATIGHKVLDQRLDIHIDANIGLTHGGVSLASLTALSADEQMFHDAIAKEEAYLVGGGLGYQISDALTVSASARLFVAGQNTQNASVFAFGVSWTAL